MSPSCASIPIWDLPTSDPLGGGILHFAARLPGLHWLEQELDVEAMRIGLGKLPTSD
jgi:hypothetical protein